MCGIAGIFDRRGLRGVGRSIQAATDIASHRGPDGSGFALFTAGDAASPRASFVTEMPGDDDLGPFNLAFGHRRLAIIDLTPAGRQPMGSADGLTWITYNGEVYNYVELREELIGLGRTFHSDSDTEVILQAYGEWGDECVQRFNGMWAFAILDRRANRLFCSRDRIGIKPFHYHHAGGRFAFASEIKQLLQFPVVPRVANRRAVYEFLAWAATDYCEETFFDGIHKLQQGHNLVLDLASAEITISRYYDPPFRLNDAIGYAEAADEFRRLLADSVHLRLRSDVEVGSCLSGGLDSTSIVCLIRDELARRGRGEIQRTFTSHFEEKEANEIEYARAVLDATGIRGHLTEPTAEQLVDDARTMTWHQDEPFASTSIFAQWSVYRLIHEQQVKVVLDGQGADEQLSGYVGLMPAYFAELDACGRHFARCWERWRWARLSGAPVVRPLLARATGAVRARIGGNGAVAAAARPDWIDPAFRQAHGAEGVYLRTLEERRYEPPEHLGNVLYRLTFLNSLQSLLRYQDRSSMAFSVEGRVPFLDYRLIEFLFSLPSAFKIRNGYTKRVLRDAMKGVIPEKIRTRVSKLGFATPERAWQHSVLRPLVRETLADERMRPYLVPEQAEAYYQTVLEHPALDPTPWRWISVRLWQDVFDLA